MILDESLLINLQQPCTHLHLPTCFDATQERICGLPSQRLLMVMSILLQQHLTIFKPGVQMLSGAAIEAISALRHSGMQRHIPQLFQLFVRWFTECGDSLMDTRKICIQYKKRLYSTMIPMLNHSIRLLQWHRNVGSELFWSYLIIGACIYISSYLDHLRNQQVLLQQFLLLQERFRWCTTVPALG